MTIEPFNVLQPSEGSDLPNPPLPPVDAQPSPEAVALFKRCLQKPLPGKLGDRPVTKAAIFQKALKSTDEECRTPRTPSANAYISEERVLKSKDPEPMSGEEKTIKEKNPTDQPLIREKSNQGDQKFSRVHQKPIDSAKLRPKHPTQVVQQSAADLPSSDPVAVLPTPDLKVLLPNELKLEQPAHSSASTVIQQIKSQVIDRILVSSSALGQNKTVTLVLAHDLLEDTQVQFTKKGSLLEVQFATKAPNSFNFLTNHQVDLQGYLQAELKLYKNVQVQVIDQPSIGTSLSKEGRSRGYLGYDAQDESEWEA